MADASGSSTYIHDDRKFCVLKIKRVFVFVCLFHTLDISSIPMLRSSSFRADDLYDLYDLAHVTGGSLMICMIC